MAIIPTNRRIDWQGNVGVPGGIPNRTTIFTTVNPGGDINAAINSCPANQVVLLAPGTFNLTGTVGAFNKNNITLRGSGMGVSILQIAAGSSGQGISFRGSYPWPPPDKTVLGSPVISGATVGSTVITVADTTNFTVNGPMNIGWYPIPPWGHNLTNRVFANYPVSENEPTYGIAFRVVSKTATTVTFTPACPFDFSAVAFGREIRAIPYTGATFVTGIGTEDLTVECAGSQDFAGIQYEMGFGNWVKNVEIAHSYSRQIYLWFCIRCEVRHCYTHDVQSVGPNHEGISNNAECAWNWFEDNICNAGGAPAIEFSDGTHHCSCNVASYNYCINTASNFWDISFSHGNGGMLNLAEGNKLRRFEDDGYFGGSSHGTLLRNNIPEMMLLKHMTVYYNIVGNVLGFNWDPQGLTRVVDTEISNYWSSNLFPIYELGFPNIGNPFHNGTFIGPTVPPDYHLISNDNEVSQELDRNVKATILRHGNWDAATNGVLFDPTIPDHVIPASYLYNVKPPWWDADLPWPSIGSDLTPMVGIIPAERRYLASTQGKVISLSGTGLAFGNCPVGEFRTGTLTVSNIGNQTLTVSSIVYPTGFSGPTAGFTVAPGVSVNKTVTFTPTQQIAYSGVVTVNSDATSGSGVISVSGTGTAPAVGKIISLSGTGLAFGNIVVGNTGTGTLTISSVGDQTLTVTGISYPTGFSGLTGGFSVPAGTSVNRTVTFAPTQTIAYSGNITVSSDATSGTNTIQVTGTGVNPPPVGKVISLSGVGAFGNVSIGNSATQTLVVANIGDTLLTVSGISYPTGFDGVTTGFTVAPGSNVTRIVTFTPTQEIPYSGNIVVTSDATSGSGTIAVSGTGVAAGANRGIALTGVGLGFGDVEVGTSATGTMTVSAFGDSLLTISGITYPGNNVFTGATAGFTLSPGQHRDITITFTPVAAVQYTGNINVASDANQGSGAIAVAGVGTPPAPPSGTHGHRKQSKDSFGF